MSIKDGVVIAKNRIKKEDANSLVENVIVLPLILIVIILIIVMCFIVHDRTCIEAAAKRGAIYASHCISNPNYQGILSQSGNQSGSLDSSIDSSTNAAQYSFTGIASNIQPYRYLSKTTSGLASNVESEVRNIIQKTCIPWRSIDVVKIKFTQNNKLYYQDVSVKVTVDYALSPVFKVVGMDPVYTYSATAVMTVNDPDEFIRNTDMIVDIIVQVDNKLGGNGKKIVSKISEIATKIIDWTKIS